MKVAITSQGKSLDAPVDPRFGHAPYILIVYTADHGQPLLGTVGGAASWPEIDLGCALLGHKGGQLKKPHG